MKKIFILIVIIIFSYHIVGQISQGGNPYSYDKKNSIFIMSKLKSSQTNDSGVVLIQSIDKAFEKEKVKQMKKEGKIGRNNYYGKEVDVSINFFKKAKMIRLENGDEIWILNIKSNDAAGYQFLFDKFYLPEKCKLFIFNEEQEMKLGAFTSQNNRDDNKFVTQFINGNSVYIELFIPNKTEKKVKLSIEKVVYIFDDIFRSDPYSVDGAAACNINVSCSQGSGWWPEIKSVVLVLGKVKDYWINFTATLINKGNNYTDTDYPFLLTANHCYETPIGISDINNWVFIFRHETTSCISDGSEISGNSTKSVVGADIVSRDNGSQKTDYLLLQLKNSVADIRNFDVSFAGWDSKTIAATSFNNVGIHHPKGDVKKISKSVYVPSEADYHDGIENKDHWRVVWNEGITEEGSSGSPLFNSTHQIIGQLTGGTSFCAETFDEHGNPIGGPNYPDWYGRFDLSWSDGNLKNYLAPDGNTNAVSTFELPHSYDLAVTANTDPQIVNYNTSFQVKANSTNGELPIRWFLWINRTPDDFNDYNYGDPNCYSELIDDGTRVFESKFYNFPEVGTYKGKIFTVDASGNQSTININILVYNNTCIVSYLLNTNCAKQIEFPKGANIRLYDNFYIADDFSWVIDPCHPGQKFFGSEAYTPKYPGIYELQWNLIYVEDPVGELFVTKTFNTPTKYQHALNPPQNPVYYWPSSQCFALEKEGRYNINLFAYAGKMETDGYQFKHPFTYAQNGSSFQKKIIVIDCEKEVLINNILTLLQLNWKVKGGNIMISNIIINSGEALNVSAYNKVVLKPGTQIKEGASFKTNMLKCPEYDCDCDKTKSSLIPETSQVINYVPNEFRTDIDEKSMDILVFPNPSTSIINIRMNRYQNIYSMEIYSTQGLLLYNIECFEDNLAKIDISKFKSGVYYIQILTDQGLITKSFVKQ